ncbi:MAG TPA: transglutaminase N-terminal domain-containing protein [Steroidobacteraceae bacterium]|nr:transglutaminase N-terminal domain-containing protein [Steroidobacteraceae bacterium]
MNRLRIQHTCEVRYTQTFQYSAQALRLTPRRDRFQHTLHWALHAPGQRAEQLDAHGNIMHLLTLEAPHRFIEVVVTGLVEVATGEQVLPHEGPLSPLAYLATTALTQPTPAVLEFAEGHRPAHGATWDWAARLARGVRELSPAQATAVDQAHALLGACRAAGVPARFVSGYRHLEEERAERTAWVDIWNASQDGWMALDVDRVEAARSRHCRLAVGRDYLEAAPVRTHRPGERVETLRIRDQ